MTHTLATMTVPADVWELVLKKLKEAGYDHAIDLSDRLLDMSGIGLVPEPVQEHVLSTLVPREHARSADCWCNPQEIMRDPESGKVTYMHSDRPHEALPVICHNCDSPMPEGCGGTFKTDESCLLRKS